jgi:hypothetical protein
MESILARQFFFWNKRATYQKSKRVKLAPHGYVINNLSLNPNHIF